MAPKIINSCIICGEGVPAGLKVLDSVTALKARTLSEKLEKNTEDEKLLSILFKPASVSSQFCQCQEGVSSEINQALTCFGANEKNRICRKENFCHKCASRIVYLGNTYTEIRRLVDVLDGIRQNIYLDLNTSYQRDLTERRNGQCRDDRRSGSSVKGADFVDGRLARNYLMKIGRATGNPDFEPADPPCMEETVQRNDKEEECIEVIAISDDETVPEIIICDSDTEECRVSNDTSTSNNTQPDRNLIQSDHRSSSPSSQRKPATLDYTELKKQYNLKDLVIKLPKLPISVGDRVKIQDPFGLLAPQNRIHRLTYTQRRQILKKALKVKRRVKFRNPRGRLFCNVKNCPRRNYFKTEYDLEMHKKQIHEGVPRPYKCSDCSKTFITKTRMNEHHRHVHLGLKTNLCELCGMSFITNRRLEMHKFVHAKERKFMCEICSNTFKSPAALRTHKRGVHTSERQFSCDRCGKPFGTMEKLRRHIQCVHYVERSVVCELCDKTFPTRHYMWNHMRSFHKVPAKWKKHSGRDNNEERTSKNTC